MTIGKTISDLEREALARADRLDVLRKIEEACPIGWVDHGSAWSSHRNSVRVSIGTDYPRGYNNGAVYRASIGNQMLDEEWLCPWDAARAIKAVFS